jgi:hypothetical protein
MVAGLFEKSALSEPQKLSEGTHWPFSLLAVLWVTVLPETKSRGQLHGQKAKDKKS